MSFLPVMQKGSLDAAHPDRHGKITKETVSLDGVSVTRVTFGGGASWSQDLNNMRVPKVANCLMSPLRFLERFTS
jgi:hypothetical protein